MELALLGLLSEGPLHGYELRKRVGVMVGPVRALSYSVLYPLLRRMLLSGFIKEIELIASSRRERITYEITPLGRERFRLLSEESSSELEEDELFGILFSFFGTTSRKSRVDILQERLMKIRAREELLTKQEGAIGIALDRYFEEWRQHNLESMKREIQWLQKMIEQESK